MKKIRLTEEELASITPQENDKDELLEEIRTANSYLDKIDWKLWEILKILKGNDDEMQ